MLSVLPSSVFHFFFCTLFFLLLIFTGGENVFAEANQATAEASQAETPPSSTEEASNTPIDVTYRDSGRNADLNAWGDFSSMTSAGSLAQRTLNFFLMITGGLALLAFMIGGAMIMLGGADEVLLERGKDILKYTSIGVAVVVLSVAITTLVQTVLYSVEP